MSKRPWLENYPEGVPHEVNPDEFSSLAALLKDSFKKFGPMPAFENFGKGITFQELDKLSDDFAAYLTKVAGLQKGDKVAIQMPNLLQYPIAMFGALKAGMTVVNTNPLYTPSEMKHQFNDSGAKVAIVLANFACNLEEILSETKIETVIVTKMGDMLGGLKGAIVNFVVKNVKKMVPPYNLPDAISFKSAMAAGARETFEAPEISGEDLAFLQYTGGTTGVSKGAMLTNRNVVANLTQVRTWMFHGGMEEGKEIFITALPLYHIFALTCNALMTVSIGSKNVLITNPRDMPAFVKELGKHPFTVITGVNTLFNGLLNNDTFKSLDFSKLKFGFGGGMAVQQVVAEKWQNLTNSPLSEGYGLTETSPVLTSNPLNGNGRIGSIGMPIPNTDIVLLDDEGKEVAPGEPGELCAKGPQVMKGYWGRPEETENSFIDGWFKTGDVAVMDETGFFKIVDRKKEMILVSGFNVYPNDVENTIASHPKVLEVAAIGVPDKKSTEAVKIYVVKSDDSLTEDELRSYAREHLTAYKCPKHIAFTDELPKSNVGKILRRIVKENDLKVNSYD